MARSRHGRGETHLIPPSLRLRDYLEHMLTAILRINQFTAAMSEATFLIDEKTQDAVIRNLEIIGEAARNVMHRHADFAQMHQAVPWRRAYEMRNAVSHGYFAVDLETIWRTVRDDLPSLEAQITSLCGALPDEAE
jgi:uncharacterized protein with HEPN domain